MQLCGEQSIKAYPASQPIAVLQCDQSIILLAISMYIFLVLIIIIL